MAKRIDGKVISKQIKDELKEEVAQLKAKGIEGSLAVIQVGNDPASSVYVNNKKKACEYIGIGSISYELPEETTEAELLDIIEDLNKREDVCGILVQLPVPKHIDEDVYKRQMQDRIIGFICEHCFAKPDQMERLMMNTFMLSKDLGTILVGKEAVEEGIINEVGGMKEALAKLHQMIDAGIK